MTGEELRSCHPEYVIREWLKKNSVSDELGVKQKVKFSRPKEFYARCAHAWNAFARGEDIREIRYYQEKTLPKIEAATPQCRHFGEPAPSFASRRVA